MPTAVLYSSVVSAPLMAFGSVGGLVALVLAIALVACMRVGVSLEPSDDEPPDKDPHTQVPEKLAELTKARPFFF